MGDKARVELSTDSSKIHLMLGNRMVEELDADQAWDLGDDLIIAAGQVWLKGTGKPWSPTWADHPDATDEWLDEAATGQLFAPQELLALRNLAAKQGLTVTQLLRQEVRATLEFAYWGQESKATGREEHGGEHGH